MSSQIIEIETLQGPTLHVIIDRGNGSFESFPADENNERYLAWVAEGNTAEVVEE